MAKINPSQVPFMLMIILLACIFTVKSAIAPATLTSQTMDSILQAIDSIVFSPTAPGAIPIKKLLRASFHDCMGGCDSRINLYNTENRGLEGLVRRIDQIYNDNNNPFKTTISRPDFWVLCELRALAWGIKKGGTAENIPVLGPNFAVYKYGRTNTTFDPAYDDIEGPFPDGIANWTGSGEPTTVLGGLTSGLKGLVSEYDIVALLGLHNAGGAAQQNSGFSGPWGSGSDQNVVNTGLYRFLMGYGSGRRFQLIQTHSQENTNGSPPETNFLSSAPTSNKLQWTRQGSTASRIMMNVDMGFYHAFTATADGTAPGKACPQLDNLTLFDCSNVDSSYMPLSSNAQQASNYIRNSTLFYVDVINAMLKLTSVPSQYDTASSLVSFYPEYVCDNGAPKCRGDVFLQNCAGFPNPC